MGLRPGYTTRIAIINAFRLLGDMFIAWYPSWSLKPFGRTGNVWLVEPVQVWAYFGIIIVGMLHCTMLDMATSLCVTSVSVQCLLYLKSCALLCLAICLTNELTLFDFFGLVSHRVP